AREAALWTGGRLRAHGRRSLNERKPPSRQGAAPACLGSLPPVDWTRHRARGSRLRARRGTLASSGASFWPHGRAPVSTGARLRPNRPALLSTGAPPWSNDRPPVPRGHPTAGAVARPERGRGRRGWAMALGASGGIRGRRSSVGRHGGAMVKRVVG